MAIENKNKVWTKEEEQHDFYLKTTEVKDKVENPFFVVLGETAQSTLVE
jgi:hypothetical protein